jgi:hypothetical protein
VLDVVFRDDHARVRKGYGARNMGLIKRIAVNLLKSATDKKRPQGPSKKSFLVNRLPPFPVPGAKGRAFRLLRNAF